MTQDNRPVAEQEIEIEEPSKSVTIRLQPRDQIHVATITLADRLTTTTEAIQRALEHYARLVKRRSS